MYRLILCLMILMMCGFSGYAQKDSSAVRIAKNSFFIEYGGNAGYRIFAPGSISLNYDRILYDKKLINVSARVGSNFPIERTAHFIPVMMNLLVGKKKFFFELGAGYEFVFWDRNYETVNSAFTSVIGLRYQEARKGIILRIGITPTFGIGRISGFRGTSLLGISLGFTF